MSCYNCCKACVNDKNGYCQGVEIDYLRDTSECIGFKKKEKVKK